jgi:hypothetical protein
MDDVYLFNTLGHNSILPYLFCCLNCSIWSLETCSDWLLKLQELHCAVEKHSECVVPGKRVKALEWEQGDLSSSLRSEPINFMSLSQSLSLSEPKDLRHCNLVVMARIMFKLNAPTLISYGNVGRSISFCVPQYQLLESGNEIINTP